MVRALLASQFSISPFALQHNPIKFEELLSDITSESDVPIYRQPKILDVDPEAKISIPRGYLLIIADEQGMAQIVATNVDSSD